MATPVNDKLQSGMKKNVLKKEVPDNHSSHIYNALPPGEHIGNQDSGADIKRVASMGIKQPLLSSTEHYSE